MRLKDLGAIVTGGARGIGAGIARCLVDEGARVAPLDLDGEEAERTAAEPGPGHIGMPAYGAAKAAALSPTRSLALELGLANVRVNAICPGLLYTRAWKVLASSIQKRTPACAEMDPYEVFLEVVKRATPLGREQSPEDIGKLAVFLCSDDACNITGQVISVDGGSLLKTGA